MSRGAFVWGLAALDIVAFIVASVVGPSDASTVLWIPVVALFLLVGALLWTRVPANPIGPMFLTAGTILALVPVVGTYAVIGHMQVPPWPGSDPARTAANALFFYPIVIALIGIPLVFPDGRLPSRRFQWVVGFLVLDVISWAVGVFFGPSIP